MSALSRSPVNFDLSSRRPQACTHEGKHAYVRMVNAGSGYYRSIDAAQHGFVFSGFGVMDGPLHLLVIFTVVKMVLLAIPCCELRLTRAESLDRDYYQHIRWAILI
jgi:hypothetical protein